MVSFVFQFFYGFFHKLASNEGRDTLELTTKVTKNTKGFW